MYGYSGIGQTVIWEEREYIIRGMGPARNFNVGDGFAAMLMVEGRSVWINTKNLIIK